jgi:NAD-dependent dihydropyrimidine dehydrogenase PreA subunit
MKLDLERCTGCGICEEVCPLGVITIKGKKAHVGEGCVECKTCMKVCPEGVYSALIADEKPACTACPILCRIPPGAYGACKRYFNEKGEVLRKGRVHTYDEVAALVEGPEERSIERPLLTGIGAGTTYPDFRPSPFIVNGVRDGVDIVTVVTEAPLSYSGLKLKVDTDLYLGQEGKRIYVRRKGKRQIGHLCTEEYGSKMLSLGGVNILTSKDGIFAAKVLFEFLRGRKIKLEVEDGAKVELTLGQAPVVDGTSVEKMRVGCGSATAGLFAPYMFNAADEVIVLDGHITALFSEHPSGKHLNKRRSGISIIGQKSTDGRYFLEKGKGWGGTDVLSPLDVIKEIDRTKCAEGMTLLITETTGQQFAFYRMAKEELREARPTKEAMRFINTLRDSCQASRVTAVFAAGVGGSARAGVTKNPIKLTRAVHEGKIRVTIGGAKPFIFPGGGINFLVDVEQITYGSIYLSPTPSFVLPVEYTMTRETFEAIGGHVEAIRPLEEVLEDLKK